MTAPLPDGAPLWRQPYPYSPSAPVASVCAAALSREAWMASSSTREVYLLSAV